MDQSDCVPMSHSPMRCAMTGLEIRDSGDGIWDDGEWISWAWINDQLEAQESGRPVEELEIEEDFEDEAPEPSEELLWRILAAKNHYEHSLNEISPDWGPIGEAYLAECFDVKLCSRHTEGHDGRWGDDLVEIKTITPHKRRAFVTVRRFCSPIPTSWIETLFSPSPATIYGIWGLYSMPGRASGLLQGQPARVTASTREFIEEVCLPQLKRGGVLSVFRGHVDVSFFDEGALCSLVPRRGSRPARGDSWEVTFRRGLNGSGRLRRAVRRGRQERAQRSPEKEQSCP